MEIFWTLFQEIVIEDALTIILRVDVIVIHGRATILRSALTSQVSNPVFACMGLSYKHAAVEGGGTTKGWATLYLENV